MRYTLHSHGYVRSVSKRTVRLGLVLLAIIVASTGVVPNVPVANAMAPTTLTQLTDFHPELAFGWLGQSASLVYYSAQPYIDGVPQGQPSLWRTDGTAVGSFKISDIQPRTEITESGALTYLMANDGVHGWELWRTDGSAAGTAMVSDLTPGTADSEISSLTDVNGVLFFGRRTNQHSEVWKTDGTPGGTTKVIDETAIPGASFVTIVASYQGNCIIVPNTTSSGRQIWKSDGTQVGTQPMLTLPGNLAQPKNFAVAGSHLFFTYNDGQIGFSLWASDGTESGTQVVKNYPDANLNASNFNPVVVGRTVYFFERDERGLWAIDGDSLARVRLGTFEDITNTFLPDFTQSSKFVFTAWDNFGSHIWATNGTPAGTVRLTPTGGGTDYYSTSRIVGLPGGGFYFMMDDGTHGQELWKTDGTVAGTALTADLNPGSEVGALSVLGRVDNTLVFTANDGTHGLQLWTAKESTVSAPTGLSGASPTNKPSLTWQPVVGANAYNIYRDGLKIGQATDTSYVDTQAAEGTASYYVTAVMGDIQSEPSNTVAIIVDQSAPIVGTIAFSTNPKSVGQTTVGLSAQLTDPVVQGVNSAVVTAEYYNPVTSIWVPMTVTGGLASATIPTSSADYPAGMYDFQIRATDAAANMSLAYTATLDVYDPAGSQAAVHGAINPNGATSNPGDVLPIVSGPNIRATIDLTVGYDNLNSVTPTGVANFSWGSRCNSPKSSCFTVETTSLDWLIVPQVSTSATIQGRAKLSNGNQVIGDGYLVRIYLTKRVAGARSHYLLQVYPQSATNASSAPLYQASGDLTAGQIVINH